MIVTIINTFANSVFYLYEQSMVSLLINVIKFWFLNVSWKTCYMLIDGDFLLMSKRHW